MEMVLKEAAMQRSAMSLTNGNSKLYSRFSRRVIESSLLELTRGRR